MDESILEGIGFTRAEVKVYLALLELGLSTAGKVIEKSGLQSSVVHMTLNNLVTKGFVSFILEGKRKHYQASDPKQILSFLEEKKLSYEKMLPQLLMKQQLAKDKSEVTSFKGIKGIKELLYELLDAGGDEYHTIGSARESLMLGDAFWISYHKRRAARKIKAKLIFNESLKKWTDQNKYPLAQYKFTKQGFEPLTETIIRNDCIGIIIWASPPLGVMIKNKIAAQSYDRFFEMLWNG